MHPSNRWLPFARGGVFLLCGGYPLWLLFTWWQERLGPLPDEVVMQALGAWGLLLLLATLALSAGYRLTGWRLLVGVRRQVGLWAFTYLCGHLLVWAGWAQFWDWGFIWLELRELAHLQLGLFGLLLLLPLAVTSIPMLQRWMGREPWQWLHALVYPAAAAGLLHVWLLSRVFDLRWLAASLLLALLAVLKLQHMQRRGR